MSHNDRKFGLFSFSKDYRVEYPKFKQLLKAVEEFRTYIQNNAHLIPNYGDRYRHGETITTSFVESTVN